MAHYTKCSSCGKEYNDMWDTCPFCGHTPTKEDKEKQVTENEKSDIPTISGWYGFATFIMVFSGIGLLLFFLIIPGVAKESPFGSVIMMLSIPILISDFIFTLIICGIMQLLAGIKLNTDKLLEKEK